MGLPWMAYFEGSSGDVPEAAYTLLFGQVKVAREGNDLTIVTISQMVHKALLAADELAKVVLVKASLEVTAPAGGRVAAVHVAAGDSFKRGQAIATLEEAP